MYCKTVTKCFLKTYFKEVALALENRGEDPVKHQEKVLETLEVCGLYEFR